MGAIESDTKAALSVSLIMNPPIVYIWLQSVLHIVCIYGHEAWSYGINIGSSILEVTAIR